MININKMVIFLETNKPFILVEISTSKNVVQRYETKL